MHEALEAMGLAEVTDENRPQIIADISSIPALSCFKEELIRGRRVQRELAKQRQLLMAQANATIEYRFMEGLGAKIMCIDQDEAWALRLKYGMSCLHDKDFRKFILKQRPEFGVRCVSGKTMFCVNGLRREREQEQVNVQGKGNEEKKSQARPSAGCGALGRSGDALVTPNETRRVRSGHEVAGARSDLIISQLSTTSSQLNGTDHEQEHEHENEGGRP